MKIENFTRLRELASAARIEWRVADPVTKSYCATFDRSDTLTPEEDAHAWLDDHRKRFPDSRHARFEVTRVEVRSELQQLAGALVDAYAALPVWPSTTPHGEGDATNPRSNDQGHAQDGRPDPGPAGRESGPGAHQHHEHRTGQPDPDGTNAERDSGSNGVHGACDVQESALNAEPRTAPNLENLQDRLLAPTPIERDDIGHWYHPHLPDCDEGVSYGDLLAVFGMEVACVAMEGDAAEEVAERYFDQGGPDCSDWTPTPPKGEGWVLLAIFDTEDGPYAMFARKAPEPRPPSLRTAIERARKFEAAYYKEARRAVEFGDIIQNHTHAMQAAVIEANLGKGTATAMAWIVNTLRGPGHLPDLDAAAKFDDPQGKGKAQVWFDLMEAQHSAFRAAHPAPQAPKGGA